MASLPGPLQWLETLIDPSRLLPESLEWVPPEHLDRLRQYDLFRAVAENRVGPLLKEKDDREKWRTYGDYGLIVDTARDAVVGDAIGIDVPGSEDDETPGAKDRQHLLDEWARRERWASKVYRAETEAAEVGDAVYELRPDGHRLRLQVHEPETFFPVWEDGEGSFSTAYLAWEEPNNGQYLPEPPVGEALRTLRDRDGAVVLYLRTYELIKRPDGLGSDDERDQVATVTAGWYALKDDDAAAAGFTRMSSLGFELQEGGEPFENFDTGFDEIPVFYVPNREIAGQPWGAPEGDRVLQVLMDLGQDHTDLRENTLHCAFPVMYDELTPVAAGPRTGAAAARPSTKSEEKYKAGTIYNGRKLGVVDLSAGNKVLLEHEGFLVEKAMRNTRTSEVMAGLADLGDVPSGYAMLIALIPTIAKTLPKRVIRRDKMGMMLKHVLRWHRRYGDPDTFFDGGWPGEIWTSDEAYPSFGSMLPVNRDEVVGHVTTTLTAEAISTTTAVAMLQAAGFPIDDAQKEVERIEEERSLPVGAPRSGFGNEGQGGDGDADGTIGIPLPGDQEEDVELEAAEA